MLRAPAWLHFHSSRLGGRISNLLISPSPASLGLIPAGKTGILSLAGTTRALGMLLIPALGMLLSPCPMIFPLFLAALWGMVQPAAQRCCQDARECLEAAFLLLVLVLRRLPALLHRLPLLPRPPLGLLWYGGHQGGLGMFKGTGVGVRRTADNP